MNESELATLILRILITMAKVFPSRDVDGAIIRWAEDSFRDYLILTTQFQAAAHCKEDPLGAEQSASHRPASCHL